MIQDLQILAGETPALNQPGQPSAAITDARRASQRFVTALITRIGSVKSDETFGTELSQGVLAAGADTARLEEEATAAIRQAIAWLRANPVDEPQVEEARLLQVTVVDQAAVFEIEATTSDDQVFRLTAPVDLVTRTD